MVRFFPTPVDSNKDFDAFYETFDESKNVSLRYNVYLTRKAFEYVKEYFEENSLFVNFFKQISGSGLIT